MIIAFIFLSPNVRSANLISKFFDETENVIVKAFEKARVRWEPTILELSYDAGKLKLAPKMEYEVDASYLDKHYLRIDGYSFQLSSDVMRLLGETDPLVNISAEHSGKFRLIRQIQGKKNALRKKPRTFDQLNPFALIPNNHQKAYNLEIGELAEIPATMNLVISKRFSTELLPNSLQINGSIEAYYLLSGEFIIQVYRNDKDIFRVRLIANRSAKFGPRLSFVAAFDRDFNIIQKRLTKKLIDLEILKWEPFTKFKGSTFIADYAFDFRDEKAREAYDQILGKVYHLNALRSFDSIVDAEKLSRKFINTTSIADEIVRNDQLNNVPMADRKVYRIFKGWMEIPEQKEDPFKVGLFMMSYASNQICKTSYITANDINDIETTYFNPTCDNFHHTKIGKWAFSLEDKFNFSMFGLIPKQNLPTNKKRLPDLGVVYERKDGILSGNEQKEVEKVLVSNIPYFLYKDYQFGEWSSGKTKYNTRIFFKIIVKNQAFKYIPSLSKEEIKLRFVDYLTQSQNTKVLKTSLFEPPQELDKNYVYNSDLPDILQAPRMELSEIDLVAEVLADALNQTNANDELSEANLNAIVKLNKIPAFHRAGIGFLMSLVPEKEFKQSVYINISMIGDKLNKIDLEYGFLNHQNVYNNLDKTRTRVTNRSYDLRLTLPDLESIQSGLNLNEIEYYLAD